MGHLGSKKTRDFVNHRFTWPGLGVDIDKFVQSCDECARFNKAGNKTVQMVDRPNLTEPYETVATDIVGPLPKGKGGARFILTMICLASIWPEAVPLRTASASEVAEGLVSIFTRTGLLHRMLTDQGKVFMGKVCKRLCEIFGVDLIHTTPYHPQTNGAIERFHGTLKPILA